jgi:transmembrane protein EpsG
MLFYIFFLLFTTALLFLGNYFPDKNKYTQPLTLAIVILIAGFRSHVGADYDSYVVWYIDKTRDCDFELGFLAILNVFRFFGLSHYYLFFFFSFFTYVFFYLGIRKYTVNANVAFVIFLLLPGLFLNSLSFVRQAFSMSISFYAFYYLINKKYLIYFILMLIGLLIHNSCLLPFVLFTLVFLFESKIKVLHLYFLLVLSMIISQINYLSFFKPFFEHSRYVYYFSNLDNPVSLLKLFALNGVCIFVLLHYDKMKETYFYQKYFLIFMVFSVVFTNVFAFQIHLTRFSYFFKIFETIVIADLIYLGSKQRKLFLVSVFYVYYFGAFMYSLKVDKDNIKEGSRFTPYNNILVGKNDSTNFGFICGTND